MQIRRKQPLLSSETRGMPCFTMKISQIWLDQPRGVLKLLGKSEPICSQKPLTTLCHDFSPVNRAVLLVIFPACTSLALVLCCIRPLMPSCPFLEELSVQQDMPSADSCPDEFPYYLWSLCSWKASSAVALASTQLLLSAVIAPNSRTKLHYPSRIQGKCRSWILTTKHCISQCCINRIVNSRISSSTPAPDGEAKSKLWPCTAT